MVITRGYGFGSGAGGHDRSGLTGDQIRKMIAAEVATSIRASIPDLIRSIKTAMIELIDDRYAALIEVAAAVATTDVSTSGI